MIWILDNGHGGIVSGKYVTPGKRSPEWGDLPQLYEGVFNREIVRLLNAELQKEKFTSLVLTPEQLDIPINERIKRVNEVARIFPDQTILLCLHANAGGGSGWEVFTSYGETESDRLATVIYSEFAMMFPGERMRADYVDGDPDKEEDFGMLKYTHCPAVLCENFFMDNRRDCQLMQSATGKMKIINAYMNAIRRYTKIR